MAPGYRRGKLVSGSFRGAFLIKRACQDLPEKFLIMNYYTSSSLNYGYGVSFAIDRAKRSRPLPMIQQDPPI